MKTMDKNAERKILDSIQSVCDHVSAGMTPTDAVIKVAEDDGLSKNFIKLVCTGYNTGATTFQREKSASVLDKMAEFPLAHTDKVLEAIYPSAPKTPAEEKAASVVSDAYSTGPSAKPATPSPLLKVALDYGVRAPAEYAADPSVKMAKAYNKATGIDQAVDRMRHKYAESQDKLLLALGRLGDFLKTSKDWTYEQLYFAAAQRHGEAGKLAVKYAAKRNNASFTAQDGHVPKFAQAINWFDNPFRMIGDCVQAAQAVKMAEKNYRTMRKEAQEKIADLLRPFGPAAPPTRTTVLGDVRPAKQAFWGGYLSGIATKSLGDEFGKIEPASDIVEGLVDDLNDPAHEDEMRKIQAQSMLQDFLSNDEIIAGYQPQEVMDAYNEIAQLSPRASTQPAVMRPLLRKRLTQGAMEPFEAAEMANIEKTIGEAQGPNFLPAKNPYEGEKKGNVLHERKHNILD